MTVTNKKLEQMLDRLDSRMDSILSSNELKELEALKEQLENQMKEANLNSSVISDKQ